MGAATGHIYEGVPGSWCKRTHGFAHRVPAGAVGTLAEEAPATRIDRADRRRPYHQLHRIVRQLSIEVDRLFDTEHDARLRRLPGSAGTLEAEPAAQDEGPEGLTLQSTSEAH